MMQCWCCCRYRTLAFMLAIFEVFLNAPIFMLSIIYVFAHVQLEDLVHRIEDDYATVGKKGKGSRLLLSNLVRFLPKLNQFFEDAAPVVTIYIYLCLFRIAAAYVLTFGAWRRHALFIYPWLILDVISIFESVIAAIEVLMDYFRPFFGIMLVSIVIPIRIVGAVTMGFYIRALRKYNQDYYF